MEPGKHLQYSIEDTPPIYLCILLGIQQFLTMVGGVMVVPLIVAQATCVDEDLVGRAELLGTLMTTSGIATLIQSLFGIRLPIIQGPAFAFLAPIIAFQNIDEFKCPPMTHFESEAHNGTILIASPQHREIWQSRLVHIQGALIIAGIVEMIFGFSGVVGTLLKFIGPLTIAPTIGLVGLSLTDEIISHYAAKYWPISISSLVLVLLFNLYLHNFGIPFPKIAKSNRGKYSCQIGYFKLFGLFPVLLAIAITWAICGILTATEVLPRDESQYGYSARTDLRFSEFNAAPWFRVPYPCQWGWPQFNLGITFGMLAAVLPSIVESLGDYIACSRMCEIHRPPSHATNRGIMIEGIGCIVAGLFGCGPGVTSFAENIGAIAMTRVGSRKVIITAAVILVLLGSFTKFAAVFMLVPDPVVGGVLISMLSMVSAVGFSNLQYIDLNITRNLLIFGLSMFMGLAIPKWVKNNSEMIKTGSTLADQSLAILLSTGMLVGGLVGFVLDNTCPGATAQQRGLNHFDVSEMVQSDLNNESNELEITSYDLPLITPWLRKQNWAQFIPILPPFTHHCRRPTTNKRGP